MRNLSFDLEAARAQGVMVCGTGLIGSPTSELQSGDALPYGSRTISCGSWPLTGPLGPRGEGG